MIKAAVNSLRSGPVSLPAVRVVGKTTESVYFSCYILPGAFHLPPGLVEARGRALSEREPVTWSVPCSVWIEGFDGGVRGRRGEVGFTVNKGGSSSGYYFVLRNDDLSIEAQQSASVSSPAVYVQLRARLIWAVGYQAAVEWAHKLVAELFGRVNVSMLSRVDFTVDVSGWDLRADQQERFVGRSKHQGKFYVSAPEFQREHTWHGKFTGLEFSKGSPLACNIYDKAREIESRKTKTWFYDIWKSNGWDGRSKIWRVEFQVKRQVLREFGLTNGAIKDLDSFDGIWQYLTRDWLRFCIPDKTRRKNWTTAPEWEVIQAAVFNSRADGPAVRRRAQKVPGLAVLVPMLRGVSTSLAVRFGCETPEQLSQMLTALFIRENSRKDLAPEMAKKSAMFSRMEALQIDGEHARLIELCERMGTDAAFQMLFGEEMPIPAGLRSG